MDDHLDALEPGDMVFCLRNGSVWLRFPRHNAGDKVPDDVLILMGVAELFQNPSFRKAMMQAARSVEDDSRLTELINYTLQ